MGLRHKLILSLFLVFLPNLVIVVYGWRYLSDLESRLFRINNHLIPSLRILQKFEQDIQIAHDTLNLHFFKETPSPAGPEHPWIEHLRQIDSHIRQVATVNSTAGAMMTRLQQFREAILKRDTRRLLEDVPLITRWFDREIATENLLIQRELRNFLNRLGAIVLATLMVGILLIVFIHHHLRRLATLVGAIKNVGKGLYVPFQNQAKPLHKKVHDEVDILTREFNSMVLKLERREATLLESERLAAIGRMGAQIAHEIRNPLNAMGLNLEVLREDLGSHHESRRTIDLLLHEVQRLERLAENYLGQSTQNSIPQLSEPSQEIVTVSQALETARELFKELHSQKQIQLEIHNPSQGIETLRSRDKMLPILLNLLRNSIQAVREKGTILMGLEKRESRLVLYVEDSGPGIPRELRPKVLKPYVSLQKGGTGLGLNIIQDYLRTMGGTLTICDPKSLRGARIECDLGPA